MAVSSAMNRSEYYEHLSGDVKERYNEKLKIIDGKDPYLLEDLVENLLFVPEISMIDLFNYLILTHSFYTGQQMKAYKGLTAYKYYESGLVQDLKARKMNSNSFVVVGKVKHSQHFREKPLQAWVIILDDGSVSSAHCTCMAGLSEVCSHVAAILFYLHARPSKNSDDAVACTSKLAQWPIPPLKNVEMAEVKSMDFVRNREKKISVPPMSSEEMVDMLEKFQQAGITSASARIMEPLASNIQKQLPKGLPNSLDCLFEEKYLEYSYDNLLEVANKINISISQEEISKIEKATRDQAMNVTWFKQRAGRITSSQFKSVCRTSIEKPSLSIIKGICYPRKMLFTSKATTYGLKHEEEALNTYFDEEKMNHKNMNILKKTGFFISEDHPEIGASPDALVECQCCERGTVEIKCPYSLQFMDLAEFAKNKNSCLLVEHGNYTLDKNHMYYYQVQCQMFVTGTKYCDFVIWSKQNLLTQRIPFDENFFKENLLKALKFFKYILKPELLGKYFTQKGGRAKVSLWCVCEKGDDGSPMIKCDNEECDIAWYHFSCVCLIEVPEGLWYCPKCKTFFE